MKTLLMTIAVLLISSWAYAKIVSGMTPLGSGTARYLGIISVYQATLFADTNAAAVNLPIAERSRCLQLRYEVGIEAGDFVAAADTVLRRQQPAAVLAGLKEEIAALHSAYRRVQPGDVYTLCYQADTMTTTLALNGVEQVAITSAEFARVYFDIWLGQDSPLDSSLRDALVGAAR